MGLEGESPHYEPLDLSGQVALFAEPGPLPGDLLHRAPSGRCLTRLGATPSSSAIALLTEEKCSSRAGITASMALVYPHDPSIVDLADKRLIDDENRPEARVSRRQTGLGNRPGSVIRIAR